jgi:hypothetical protein
MIVKGDGSVSIIVVVVILHHLAEIIVIVNIWVMTHDIILPMKWQLKRQKKLNLGFGICVISVVRNLKLNVQFVRLNTVIKHASVLIGQITRSTVRRYKN